jgi:hypothetical protein
MKVSTVFVINTIVLGLFGLGGLFMPVPVLGVYGLEGGDAFLYAVRIASAANVVLAVMTFVARNAGPSKARDAMLLGLTIYAALHVILAVITTLNGTTNAAGWSNAGLFAVMLVLFIIAGRASMQSDSA